MTPLIAVLIALLLFTLTLASYVDRMYSEMGKFLAGEFQENIDAWEKLVEPRLGLSRNLLALSAAVLTQLSLACLALLFGAMLFDGAPIHGRPSTPEVAQAVFGAVLVIILFNRLAPFVFLRERAASGLCAFGSSCKCFFTSCCRSPCC